MAAITMDSVVLCADASCYYRLPARCRRCGGKGRIGGFAMTINNLPAVRERAKRLGTKAVSWGKSLPLQPKHVWAIRVRLELAKRHRDLALFNMVIDSTLRGCDLVSLRVTDSRLIQSTLCEPRPRAPFGQKRLSSGQMQATLSSSGSSLGGCRLRISAP